MQSEVKHLLGSSVQEPVSRLSSKAFYNDTIILSGNGKGERGLLAGRMAALIPGAPSWPAGTAQELSEVSQTQPVSLEGANL